MATKQQIARTTAQILSGVVTYHRYVSVQCWLCGRSAFIPVPFPRAVYTEECECGKTLQMWFDDARLQCDGVEDEKIAYAVTKALTD